MIKQVKIFLILFASLVSALSLKSQTFQNLVPNGSFETHTQCPNNSSQVYFAPPWTGPTVNSSDLFDSCSSVMNVPYICGGIGSFYPCYLRAKAGHAFAGSYTYQLGIPNFREYLEAKLNDTLKSGFCYYVEFYAANYQLARYSTNNISASFSNINYPINLVAPGIIPNIPQHITNYNNPVLQDTVKWHKVSGLYAAQGGEAYIILGNFKNDLNTDTVNLNSPNTKPYSTRPKLAYIFIDAVSVFSINPSGNLPWSYRDTTIIKGDSVYIGNKMGGLNFHPKWFDMNGNYISTNAAITVRPLLTSSYVVQYTICGVQRVDTLEVKVLPDVGMNELRQQIEELKIFPVPAGDAINLSIENEKLFAGFNQMEIYNNLGVKVQEEEISFKNKTVSIKTDNLSNGLYSLRLYEKRLDLPSMSSGQSPRRDNQITLNKRFVISR